MMNSKKKGKKNKPYRLIKKCTHCATGKPVNSLQ